mgnify:CR=1 FL=1
MDVTPALFFIQLLALEPPAPAPPAPEPYVTMERVLNSFSHRLTTLRSERVSLFYGGGPGSPIVIVYEVRRSDGTTSHTVRADRCAGLSPILAEVKAMRLDNVYLLLGKGDDGPYTVISDSRHYLITFRSKDRNSGTLEEVSVRSESGSRRGMLADRMIDRVATCTGAKPSS